MYYCVCTHHVGSACFLYLRPFLSLCVHTDEASGGHLELNGPVSSLLYVHNDLGEDETELQAQITAELEKTNYNVFIGAITRTHARTHTCTLALGCDLVHSHVLTLPWFTGSHLHLQRFVPLACNQGCAYIWRSGHARYCIISERKS